MKLLSNIFIFTLCFTLSAFSQTNITLSGVLIDKSTREPVLSGSVELLLAKDSAYIAGAISNEKGEFTLRNLKPDSYILKVTYIGYLPLFKNITLKETESVTRLGELPLEANEILLKEAIVEGKRPEISVKNDTLEYDAGSFKTSDNAVVEDLLKKLPGIEVDSEGKITAQGKSVNKMFLNGKEFFADDPKIASKNVPAEMVDKVQVYDRKSEMARMTGFDTGDEETVINLTVRSSMLQGTIGTAQLGAGQDIQNDNDFRFNGNAFVSHQQGNDRYTLIANANNNNNMGGADIMGAAGGGGGGGGVRVMSAGPSLSGGGPGGGMRTMSIGGGNIAFSQPGITKTQNYMANFNKEFSTKLTLGGDLRFSRQERNTLSDNERITFSQLLTQQEKTNQLTANYGNNLFSNLRLDWNPNDQNTLIFRPNIRYSETNRNGTEYNKRTNMDNNTIMLNSKSLTSSGGNMFGFGGALDYSFRFSKIGRVFSISMNGNYNNNYSQPRNITYYPTNPVDSIYNIINQNQIAENKSLTDNFRTTVSFVEPLGNKNYIQFLYRYSFSETDSKNSTYNILRDLLNSSGLGAIDTARIVPNQSRTILRNSTDQRFGINFKADRQKYNLTVGFNIDPSNSTSETYQPKTGSVPFQLLPQEFSGKLPLIKGDSLISTTPINVRNFSPTLDFRYIYGQRKTLRITYNGETNQPTADQLRDYPYVDINRPNDVTQGNPNLKPSYTNFFSGEFSNYIAETQLMYRFSMNGSFVMNDIITLTQLESTGKNVTTYKNVNGNWNTMLMGMINKPLNKKFSVGNTLMTMLANDNSYVGEKTNAMKNQRIVDNLNFKYQPNDNFYMGVNGTLSYNNVTYSAVPDNNQTNYTYAAGANFLWTFLPKWTLESDINRSWRSGYPVGYNVTQTLWNASITRQLFKQTTGTGSLKLQVFDILQDRKNINVSQTASYLQFSKTNVIPSYFMASFVYRFSIFPKSSILKVNDMIPGRVEGGPGGPVIIRREGGGPPIGGGGERRMF